MPLQNSIALVLDVFDLQERDRIVTFLTPELGKKRGVAKGSRTKFSRFAGQLQVLAKVHVRWFEKESLDLVRISDVELVRPAAEFQRELEDLLLGSYMAEYMRVFAQENEESSRLFRLLDTTLEALLAGADRNLAARYYEIWLLRLSGIFPPPRVCPGCGSQPLVEHAAFLDSESMLVCLECSDGRPSFRIGHGELDFLRRSARENLAQLGKAPPAAGTLGRIEELCTRVRRNFLQSELKSYRVMKATLASLP